ncbi:MAG: LpxI family protein [Shimia sp.]
MSLAILAGSGALPRAVAEAQTERPLIVSLGGAQPDGLTPDRDLTLETLASDLEALKAAGVDSLCLAGGVSRPTLDPSNVEPATFPLLTRIAGALAQGDDAALRALMGILTEQGFTLVPAHEAAPGLCPDWDAPTKRQATDADAQALTKARAVLEALAPEDVGQAVVTRGSHVLAVETLFGTEWMLRSLRERPSHMGQGGLLVKAPKHGQDFRADMPAIGPDTVDQAAAADLDGIAIARGHVIVLDQSEVLAKADEAGLLLWAFEPAP